MKELKAFTESELQILKETLEKASGLLFPDDATRFGALKFHFYSAAKANEYHFQIFWGPHKIFSRKHIQGANKDELLRDLQLALKKSANSIVRAAVQYCEDRLNDFLQIELQPLLNKHGLDLLQLDIRVRQSKKKLPAGSNGGWPVWCLLMAWTDEFGEFQEFVHKIVFDVQRKQFNISAVDIVKQFINYRNSLL
ncbi:hypothetical protein ACX8XP_07880 [Calditrichota bacterium LG25]